MKVIYVAGKYSGPTHDARSYMDIERNILVAREWAIKLMSMVPGIVTLVPHLQDFWYNADLELLRRCDAIFMLPNWKDSKGVGIERAVAIDAKMPVFYSLAEVQQWLASGVVPPATPPLRSSNERNSDGSAGK